MKFLTEIAPETQKMLRRINQQSKYYQVRERAQAILLSSQGYRITELMEIFLVSRRTIHNWFKAWEASKLVGLYNRHGRGRKLKLSEEDQAWVKELVKESPKDLKRVVGKLEEQRKIKVSKDTVKRVLKNLKFSWRRMKRGLGGKPQNWEYEIKIERLKELIEEDKSGKIELRYLDEVGLSLTPSIPYAWQEKGERITIKSQKTKRINVVGVMAKNQELFWEMSEEYINSNLVINLLDKLSNNLKKKTVIVMDQASIHTSDNLLKNLEKWSAKGLEIFWLPPYSPQLNLIEILWKFIKYEWIEVEAYESWENLKEYLKKTLNGFNNEYVINFT